MQLTLKERSTIKRLIADELRASDLAGQPEDEVLGIVNLAVGIENGHDFSDESLKRGLGVMPIVRLPVADALWMSQWVKGIDHR